jgi:hypothetical protein
MADEVELSADSIKALAAAINSARPNNASTNSNNTSSSPRNFGNLTALGTAAGEAAGFLNSAGSGVEFIAKKLSDNFGFLGDAVGGAATYLTDTQSVFRNLSKVGAGFNGDLGALRAGAAQTRMPLDMFANMVGNNATALLGLGASVNKGTARFTQLSAAMFNDGVIDGMMNLGYTIEEANELLLTNAAATRRSQMLSGSSDSEVAAATLRMAENMAIVAEITGKSAKQQANDLADTMRDGRNIAANRSMEARGIKDATATMAQASLGLGAVSPAAQAFMSDMNQTGVAMTPLTQNFAQLNPRTAEAIKAVQALRESNMNSVDKQAAIDRQLERVKMIAADEFTNANNRFAGTIGQVSAVGQSAADNIAATEDARLAREKYILDEQRKRPTMSVADLTEEYFRNTSDTVRGQTAGGDTEQSISRNLNRATIQLANTASDINLEIATNLSQNTDLQRAIAESLSGSADVVDGLSKVLTDFAKGLADKYTNSIEVALNPFNELFTPLVTNNMLDVNVKAVEDSINGVSPETITADALTDMELQRLQRQQQQRDGKPETTNALGGSISAGTASLVGEYGPETFIPNMDGAIIPNMKAMLNRMPDMAKALQSEMAQFGTPISDMAKTMQNELSSMGSSMSEAAQSVAATSPGMSGGGSIEQKLDILNQTMLQLVSINSIQARTGEKHLKASRSSGNLMSGIGRA